MPKISNYLFITPSFSIMSLFWEIGIILTNNLLLTEFEYIEFLSKNDESIAKSKTSGFWKRTAYVKQLTRAENQALSLQ